MAENEQWLDILNAAAVCFSANGIEVTSVDDIARELGATKGKIYYHFRTKREIMLQVWRFSVVLTIEGSERATKPHQSPSEKIFAMAYAHAMSMMTHQHFHRTAIECMRRPVLQVSSNEERLLAKEIKAKQEEYENKFREVIAEGIQCCEFRNELVSTFVHSVISLLHAPAHWYREYTPDPEANRVEIANQMARMAVGSLSKLERVSSNRRLGNCQ